MPEHVTYHNTSDDPSATTRTMTYTVNDGSFDSAAASYSVAVTAAYFI